MRLSQDEVEEKAKAKTALKAAIAQQAKVLQERLSTADVLLVVLDRIEALRRELEKPTNTEVETAAIRGALAEIRRIHSYCQGGKALEFLATAIVRRRHKS